MFGKWLIAVVASVGMLAVLLIVVRSVVQRACSHGQEVAVLSLSTVVASFKRSEVIERLKRQTSLKAVVLRTTLPDGCIRVTLCLYDGEANAVSETLGNYVAKRLEDDLVQVFGEKDMLVLK